MKIYLVGGAVRDHLLGRPIKDRDYVVIGATPEEMLEQGYIPVGKHFPVFLHPQTKEEYALARKEIKTGPRHQDFTFDFSSSVSLEEDLFRRDFTINAMAMDGNKIIDPFNGQRDLFDKILRPVSQHFKEDALRILRAARFATILNFNPSDELKLMINSMLKSNDLNYISGERIWLEVEKSLSGNNPLIFWNFLNEFKIGNIKWRLSPNNFLNIYLGDLNCDEKFAWSQIFIENHDLAWRAPSRVLNFSKIVTSFYQIFKDDIIPDAEVVYECLRKAKFFHDKKTVASVIKILEIFLLAKSITYLKKVISLERGNGLIKNRNDHEKYFISMIRKVPKI